MIRALRPILRELSILYLKRALREMPALHPDTPFVVLRINQLEWERK